MIPMKDPGCKQYPLNIALCALRSDIFANHYLKISPDLSSKFSHLNLNDVFLQWSNSRISYVFYRGFFAIYWLIWTITGMTNISGTANWKFYYAYLNHWTEWLLVISLIVNFIAAIEGLHASRHPDHASKIFQAYGLLNEC